MDLRSQSHDNALIITACGNRIDASCAIQFKDNMRELTKKTPERVILDLKKVNFVDSSGLGAIVAVMKQLGADVRLELAALTPAVDKVFRLTRMDSVFVIHECVSAAGAGASRGR